MTNFRYEVFFQTMANGGFAVAGFENKRDAVSFADKYAKENGLEIGDKDNSNRETCYCEVLDTKKLSYDEDGELDADSLSDSTIHITKEYYTKD